MRDNRYAIIVPEGKLFSLVLAMCQQHVMMYVIISLHEFSGNCTRGASLFAVHYLFLTEVLHSENPSGLKQQHK